MHKKESMMPPVPEDATAASLWVKLHNERKMWKDLVKRKEEEKEAGINQVTRVSYMVLAQMIRTFGKMSKNEYTVTIDQPTDTWMVKAEKLKNGKYKLRTWKIEV